MTVVGIFHGYLSREIYVLGIAQQYHARWSSLRDNRTYAPSLLCSQRSALLWTGVIQEVHGNHVVAHHRIFVLSLGDIQGEGGRWIKWRIHPLSYVMYDRERGDVPFLVKTALGAQIVDRDTFVATGENTIFRLATGRLLRRYASDLLLFDKHVFHQMFAFAYSNFMEFDAAQTKIYTNTLEDIVHREYSIARLPPQTPSTPHNVPVEIQSLIIEFICGERLDALLDKWPIIRRMSTQGTTQRHSFVSIRDSLDSILPDDE